MRHNTYRLLAMAFFCLAGKMKIVCAATVLLSALCAFGQENEIAFTAGLYRAQHVHVISDNIFALEGNVARRIVKAPRLSLYIELPIAASLSARAEGLLILPGQALATRNYSAFFISPGLRLKLVPGSRLSPYFAIGGGLAHFSKSGGSGSTNTNVLDFGGGIDFKITRYLALRVEARDFYSGPPQIITGLLDREHQILATGGVVFRF